MRRYSFGLIGMAAATLAFPALADDAAPADKPTPNVGDIFVYAKGFTTVDCARWEVTAVAKDGYDILQCGTKTAYIDAATATLSKIVDGDKRLIEFKPHAASLSFPLQVGKKWEAQYEGYRADNGYNWKSKVNCEAKAMEKVTVKAGEFQAYRIECADHWELSPFSGEADATTWYVPQLGTVVKSVNPQQGDFDQELVSYKVR